MIVVLADAADARGFALAGAFVRRCRTREDVVACLRRMTTGEEVASAVLMSAPMYALAAAEVDAWRDRPNAPPLLVLPATGS
jgi:vacuolar-type H+-ATPase subunit F/Vma7